MGIFSGLFSSPCSEATTGEYHCGDSVPVHAGSFGDFAGGNVHQADYGDQVMGISTPVHVASFGEYICGDSVPVDPGYFSTLSK
ncbi:hypothetical protein [Bosea sp. MMO-172]|uniref:hypothetical protein n=1 Tax=Bosea sp. MMO-172 TaxID=3127885 RepID=UPI00301703BC